GQGQQLVAAVQQVGDGTRGQDDAARRQGLVDLRHGAVLGVAEGADVGHDVQAELVVGQGQASLGLGPAGGEGAAAAAAVAAADEQVEAADAVEGGDAAAVAVVGGQAVSAGGAGAGEGLQAEEGGGQGSGRGPWHGNLRETLPEILRRAGPPAS